MGPFLFLILVLLFMILKILALRLKEIKLQLQLHLVLDTSSNLIVSLILRFHFHASLIRSHQWLLLIMGLKMILPQEPYLVLLIRYLWSRFLKSKVPH